MEGKAAIGVGEVQITECMKVIRSLQVVPVTWGAHKQTRTPWLMGPSALKETSQPAMGIKSKSSACRDLRFSICETGVLVSRLYAFI